MSWIEKILTGFLTLIFAAGLICIFMAMSTRRHLKEDADQLKRSANK